MYVHPGDLKAMCPECNYVGTEIETDYNLMKFRTGDYPDLFTKFMNTGMYESILFVL